MEKCLAHGHITCMFLSSSIQFAPFIYSIQLTLSPHIGRASASTTIGNPNGYTKYISFNI